MSYFYPQAAVKLRILPEDYQVNSDAAKQDPFEVIVVPKDLVVNINDHKTADSFSCELDYKNFPFDPRTIRACGITIYMQDMGSLQNPNGTRNIIVPSNDNVVFAGFVDEDTIDFDESKRVVHFEGRDYTSLFIDQKYNDPLPITPDQPLDKVLGLFLSSFKATQEIKLITKGIDGVLPTLNQFYPDYVSPLAGHRNTGPHENYWDIMQDFVQKAGLIAYIHLDQLILTTPRNLYKSDLDAKFIYGINIKSLKFKRKLGRFKNFNILVRSRVGKEVLTAEIPREATDIWAKSFGIKQERVKTPVLKPDGTIDKDTVHDAPLISFPVPKVANKDALIRIGQSAYEDYSRQQLEGSLDTHDMLSHSGVKLGDKYYKSYDLLHLSIGQPLNVELAIDDLLQISRLGTPEQRAQYLVVRGYPSKIATIFASTMGKFSPRFYTKSYTLSLNQDSAFKFHAEIINFVELTHRGFA